MSVKTIPLTDELYDYLIKTSVREPEIFTELRKQTSKLSSSKMQISPEQGQFMAMLVKLISAKKTLDIGVYTGYSAMSVAYALPDDGKVVGCDINVEWTKIAKTFWEKAGVAQKIDLRIAPALDTLDALIAGGESETFDFSFIDADKQNYLAYYERSLTLLRQGGLIAVDNVLWGGAVADPSDTSSNTQAIREFNLHLFSDERVDISMVPIGDGLYLARKR